MNTLNPLVTVTVHGETWTVPHSAVQSLIGWLDTNAVKESADHIEDGVKKVTYYNITIDLTEEQREYYKNLGRALIVNDDEALIEYGITHILKHNLDNNKQT